MAWPVLVFDIETIPDMAGWRRLNGVPEGLSADCSDPELFAWCKTQRAEHGQSDFMPLHLQRILCISCVFRNADGLRVHSFVDRDGDSEGKVVQTFFNAIEKHSPQLVSWNGSGFDLPVLHYRGLIHGVVADHYWDMGEVDRESKWNNYISRYHMRHLDLMDLLAKYTPRANAPLDAMAKLCGFPGKLGMDGGQVYEQYLAGQIEDVRRYCETDVMNTYLLYCRFQKMRGGFTEAEYEQEIGFVQQNLLAQAHQAPHWQEFLQAWA